MTRKHKTAILAMLALYVVAETAGCLLDYPTGLLAWRLNTLSTRIQRLRRMGIREAKAGNYIDAVEFLAQYLSKSKNEKDTEAMYLLAISRREVPESGGMNIFKAIKLLRTIIVNDSSNMDAKWDLLALYDLVGYNSETIELADDMMHDNPANYEALRRKAVALGRLRRFEEALRTADQVLELNPTNVSAMMVRVETMMRLDQPAQKILEYVGKLMEKNPEDPRFELVAAYAYDLLADTENEKAMLRRLAQRPMQEARLVRQVIHQLDGAGLYEDSLALLRRTTDAARDPVLLRLLVERLWENAQLDELLALMARVDLKSPKTHSELLAFKAMALIALRHEPEQVGQIVELLKERRDISARVWTPVLTGIMLKPGDPRKAVEICRLAMVTDSANPYLRYFLAEAYKSIGEQDLALEQWKTVTKLNKTWAAPYIRMAQVLSEAGRHRQAILMGREAVRHAPTNTAALAAYSNALGSVVMLSPQANPELVDKLRELLGRIQAAVPLEINTLPLWIEMLARDGRKDPNLRKKAIELVRSALAKGRAVDQQVAAQKMREQSLIRLAVVCRDNDLAMAQECFGLSEHLYGMTPALAGAMAADRVILKGPEIGKQYMADLMDQADRRKAWPWQLQWAYFLTDLNDQDNIGTWKELARQYPDNLAIQAAVLNIPTLQADRTLIDETIRRVQALTGDDGVNWRMARAKWLLTGPNAQRDVAAAVALLYGVAKTAPELIEPRLLLASALQMIDNISGAAEQLEHAITLEPDNLDLPLALASLRVMQSDFNEARVIVQRILEHPQISEVQLRNVAAIQSQIGDLKEAVQTLTRAGGVEDPALLAPDLTLAEVYFRNSQFPQAQAIFAKLMEEPTAQIIQAYVGFLGATGRVADAQKVLLKLEQVQTSPATRLMIRAEFARQYQSPETAADFYRQAIAQAPQMPVPYLQLMSLYLKHGRIDAMLEVNHAASQAIAGNPVFMLLEEQSPAVRAAAGRPELYRLINSMLLDPEHRAAAAKVLEIMFSAQSRGETIAQVLPKLWPVIDRSPRFLALRILAVDLYAKIGRLQEAADMSSNNASLFPNSPEAVEQATRILALQQNWRDMLAMAQLWRQRSYGRYEAPDTAIAEAKLNLGDIAGAIQTLQAYPLIGPENADRYADLLTIRCRALAAGRRSEEAARLLKPLLGYGPRWRVVWMNLAMNWIGDSALRVSWLDQVQSSIPATSESEWMTLAECWYRLGVQGRDSKSKDKALAMAREIALRTTAGPAIVTRYAAMAEQQGDVATAQTQYRRALALDPNQPMALNNLALLMADNPAETNLALEYASRCVKLEPQVATNHDTLATVQLKRREFDSAVQSLRMALQIEPGNLEWRANLAYVYCVKGDLSIAAKTLQDLELLEPDTSKLTEPVRKRIQEVKQMLNAHPKTASK